MTPVEEPGAKTHLHRCGAAVERCGFCDQEDCRDALCYRCVWIALGSGALILTAMDGEAVRCESWRPTGPRHCQKRALDQLVDEATTGHVGLGECSVMRKAPAAIGRQRLMTRGAGRLQDHG
jgi:hypothetical protein